MTVNGLIGKHALCLACRFIDLGQRRRREESLILKAPRGAMSQAGRLAPKPPCKTLLLVGFLSKVPTQPQSQRHNSARGLQSCSLFTRSIKRLRGSAYRRRTQKPRKQTSRN